MIDLNRSFTKQEAAEALGLTPRTISFYTEQGLVVPEVENPTGKGTTRRYSRNNLYELLLIKELSKNGFTLQAIKKLMAHFAHVRMIREGRADSKTVLIIYDGHSEHGEAILDTADENSRVSINLKELTGDKVFSTASISSINLVIIILPHF